MSVTVDDRIGAVITDPDVYGLLTELASLFDLADSTTGATRDTARSTEPASPVEARLWAAGQLRTIMRDVRRTTARTQQALDTPDAERVAIDPDGACSMCGTRRRSSVRSSVEAQRGRKATVAQLERITELAVEHQMRLLDVEAEYGVRINHDDLAYDDAQVVIRALARRNPVDNRGAGRNR